MNRHADRLGRSSVPVIIGYRIGEGIAAVEVYFRRVGD